LLDEIVELAVYRLGIIAYLNNLRDELTGIAAGGDYSATMPIAPLRRLPQAEGPKPS
jgi:hypothetical protein